MIKYKLILVTFFIIGKTFTLLGQDESKLKSRHIKLYTNGFYKYSSDTEPHQFIADADLITSNENYDFGFISISYELDNGGFFSHEFELMPIRITHDKVIQKISRVDLDPNRASEPLDGNKLTTIGTYISYQMNHYFLMDKLVNPYLSPSARISYTYRNNDPLVSQEYQTIDQRISAMISIIPGLAIRLRERILLDLNLPIPILDMGYNNQKIESPTLPDADRIKSSFSSEWMPNYIYFRIGIRYSLL